MSTTQIKDGFAGGSDNQLKVNSDGSINVDATATISGTIDVAIQSITGVEGQKPMATSLPVTIASDQTQTPFALKLDDYSTANVIYVGIAAVGSATSAAVWQIKKIDQTTGMSITWAGSAAYNQVWDNRTSLVYN